jgi:hypothetical protein
MAKEFVTIDIAIKHLEVEFVPYEIAKKMYLLGFDEPCFAFYSSSFAKIEAKLIIGEIVRRQEHYHGQICSAPLWQQVARFLYNISNNKIIFIINGKDNYKDLCKKLEEAIEDFGNL